MRPAAPRSTIVAVVLALTVVLAALLTYRAITAERDHRVSAERVLNDYAALGADGATARLKNALSGRFYPVLTAAAAIPTLTDATIGAVRSAMTGAARDVADATIRLARIDTVSGAMKSVGAPLTTDNARALADTVRAAARTMLPVSYFALGWVTTTAGAELVVIQLDRTNAARHTFVALTMPRSAAQAVIAHAIATEVVLPPSLAHGVSLDSGVMLRVMSREGTLGQRGSSPASPFHAVRLLGAGYADLSLDVTLAESLAPALIAGGLPPSRVPLLIAALVIIVALVLAVADQLRRERELMRLRDDFVASVSHELRTPLAQIRLFAETLRLARVRTPEEGERSLAIVENEAKRLEHMVGNLLHFTRSERGISAAHLEPTDLSALVAEIAFEFAPLAQRAGSTIATMIAPGIHARVDRSGIRQLLINLLDNAVKYGRGGQVIGVECARNGDMVTIAVTDEGPGIAPGERDLVWERFWRGESSRRAGVTGTGIGLAIVNDVARLHGGSAQVESSAKGGGRIVVTLPRSGA